MKLTENVIQGFITKCASSGMNETQTSIAMRTAGLLGMLQVDAVKQGFENRIKSASVDLSHVMTPENIAMAVETRLHHGDGLFERSYREQFNPHVEPMDETIKTAAALWDQYNNMDDRKRLITAALLGAGIGGASRMMTTTPVDAVIGRTPVSKAFRGALTGAATGAGAEAGRSMGHQALEGADPRNQQIASVMSGLAGGYLSNRAIHGAGAVIQ